MTESAPFDVVAGLVATGFLFVFISLGLLVYLADHYSYHPKVYTILARTAVSIAILCFFSAIWVQVIKSA